MNNFRQYYDSKKKQLVYIGEESNGNFWDLAWRNQIPSRKELLTTIQSPWVTVTNKYLAPKDGLILEGGCGRGVHVAAFANSGFNVIGVDYAERTVRKLNQIVPEYDIRVDDVRCLKLASGSVSGYWSLGVIEHFSEGYYGIADEMYRVIKPEGYLFLVFPYMNLVRIIKSRLGMYDKINHVPVENFFQYALNKNEVISYFEGLGFALVEKNAVLKRQGFEEEFEVLSTIYNRYLRMTPSNIIERTTRAAIVRFGLGIMRHCGYSIMLVLKKFDRDHVFYGR